MEIEIKETKRKGRGLFAGRYFKKGEKVYSYPAGKILENPAEATEKERPYLDIAGNYYEIIEPPARYINHSCDPNVEERGRAGYAMRNIASGEEITIDYDKISYLKKPMRCLCGSGNCRGMVFGKKL